MTTPQSPAPGVAAVPTDTQIIAAIRSVSPEVQVSDIRIAQARAVLAIKQPSISSNHEKCTACGGDGWKCHPMGDPRDGCTAPPLPAQVQAATKYPTVKIEDCELIEFDSDQPDGEFALVPLSHIAVYRAPAPGMAGGVVPLRDGELIKMANIAAPHQDRDNDMFYIAMGRLVEAHYAIAPHPAPAQQAAGADESAPDSCPDCGDKNLHFHALSAGSLKKTSMPAVSRIWGEQGLVVTRWPTPELVKDFVRKATAEQGQKAGLTNMRGILVLRGAIEMLREEAVYRDDEGEDTDALEELLFAIEAGRAGS